MTKMNRNLMIAPHRKTVMKKMEAQIHLLNTSKNTRNSCKCNNSINKQVISYLAKTESDLGLKTVSLQEFLLLIRIFTHYSSKTMLSKISRCKVYLISQYLMTI